MLVPPKPKCSVSNQFIWIWALKYKISFGSFRAWVCLNKEMNDLQFQGHTFFCVLDFFLFFLVGIYFYDHLPPSISPFLYPFHQSPSTQDINSLSSSFPVSRRWIEYVSEPQYIWSWVGWLGGCLHGGFIDRQRIEPECNHFHFVSISVWLRSKFSSCVCKGSYRN